MIGRTVRAVLGVVLLLVFYQVLQSASGFLVAQKGWSVPGGDLWFAAIGCFLVLPRVINDSFGFRWGRRLQIIFLGLAAVAAAVDLAIYKVVWAAPLGLAVVLLVLCVIGFAGMSFVVAAVAAVPG